MVIIYVAILVIVFVSLIVGLYQKNTNVICKSKKRLDGKTAIVTGGTSGMGLRIATDFADRGARVIVACPFVDEGTRGRKHIIARTGNENVVFMLLDLSSLRSIRKFVDDINATEQRLDILVNNAGVGTVKDRVTKDGMGLIMQINYFGQFLLTLLLLPLLYRSATHADPARIVNTASVLHMIGVIDFDKINKSNWYYTIQHYANSKLCLVLFTRALAKRLNGSNVVVNTVDPGAVGTSILVTSTSKIVGSILTFLFSTLFKTPWEGAQTAIHVALDRRAGTVSGEYFKNCRVWKAKKMAYDEELVERLWEESVRLVGLQSDQVAACFSPKND